MAYYALTSSGLDRVEKGLPDSESDYTLVLGAIADLEEQNPLRPHGEGEIKQVMRKPPSYTILATLKDLMSRGYIEEIQRGDERFPDFQ